MTHHRVFLILLIAVSPILSSQAYSQNAFSPVWQSVPWDSGGLAPNSAAWSMVATDLDLDNDGKKEFLVSSAWSGVYHNSVYLYEAAGNNAIQLIWSYSFYQYSNDYSAVTVADLDGNGRKEIICLVDPYDSTYHGFYVFEWNGLDNGFPALPTTTWAMNLRGAFDEGTAILGGDFDNDGRDEVAVFFTERYSLPKSKLMVFSLAPSSTFANPTWRIELNDSTTFLYSGYSLALTDLDRDGRKELVAIGWEQFHLAIYEHTGSPDTYARVLNLAGSDTTVDFSNMGCVEANFDNDGTNELYIATATGRLLVVTNPGDVSQITQANISLLHQYNTLRGLSGAAKADLNSDGKPEIYLAGSYHEAVFRWTYNAGPVTNPASYLQTIVFQDDTTDNRTPGSDQGWFRPSKVLPGDLDNDGRPDIVIASASFAYDKPVLMMVEQTTTDAGYATATPVRFTLKQNYPNPFNPSTTISYSLSERNPVRLTIADAAGREISVLVDEVQDVGEYSVPWNAGMLASGSYFYRLTTGAHSETRKMLFIQ